MTANRNRISFGGDENILELGIEMFAQLCEYTKTY